MIIHKIKMINFRCFQNKTIDFENKSVVLLSAANGIGKTTTIDAIEWCLTGNIGRLKTTFDTRSTNEADRRMNTDGILKNRNAKSKENIIVSLWLYDGEKERILCRRQKKDELNSEFSKVTLDENEEMAKIFIREYVGNSFYNFHFCDVQKSFNVQNKKRKELKDFFGEFITNYDEQKQIAENLDIFAEDVERYIEDKTKQKVSQDLIKNQEEEFAKTCEEAKKIPYPATIFYPNEKIEIVELNKAELTEQKKEVENCGYLIVEERLFKLIKNEALKNQQRVIKEIVSYWETKSVSIQRAVKAGLWKSIETITNLEEKLKKLKTLSLSKDSILQDGEYILALESAGFTKVDFDADKQKINEKQKKVKALSDEIDLLSKNNKMLKLLSSLLANKQVVIEHRNNIFKEKGSVRCPICGSELFATMDEEMILKEADTYIEENGKTVSIKEADKITLQNEIEILYQNVINRAKELPRDSFTVRQHLKYVELYSEESNYQMLTYEDTLLVREEVAPLILPESDEVTAVRFDALMYGIELASLVGKKYTSARKDLLKKVSGIAGVANIPEIQAQAGLIDQILHTDYMENAGINEFENIRENLRDLMKYIPDKSRNKYMTNFTDEILSTEWKEAELENDDLKNYKARVEYYVRQHQDDHVISKLKKNQPLTEKDVDELEKILWSELGTKEDYEAEFGRKPLGEFIREMVGLDMNAAKEAFSKYLEDVSLDSRQIYFVNQIIEYIVHNGMMKDLSVLLESPFTDRGSISEIFTDMSVWLGIKKVIDTINGNAAA